MELMKSYSQSIGIALRPHYKSNKCTAIAHMQIRYGAKGIACAKLSEAEDLILSGIDDVLVANQITDAGKVARLAYLAGCCRLTVCVDNAENIRLLEACASIQNTTVHCLVEYDVGMNRNGVETPEDFVKLAKLTDSCPHLVFEGIQAYAGNLALKTDRQVRVDGTRDLETKLSDLIKYAKSEGLEIKEVSGESTGTAFLKDKDSVYTEIQAGSYVFMDTRYGALDLGFKNSLFVLAQVMGVNSGWVITDAGLKSVAIDGSAPVFAKYSKNEIKLSEEHCKIANNGVTEKIGDRLAIIPGHCCTQVNLHDWLYMVREGKVIDRVPINSRGKSR
jgi:D-serine deaminase-like pyridoxal phosphate-dependent protein